MERKELIEKARELLACGALSKEAYDAIRADFPELKESEDERIRKALIEEISEWSDDTGFGSDVILRDKVLAWLEKQKEQKPVEPSDEELEKHQNELLDFKTFAAKQAKEHHISFVHDFEWNNFCGELLSYFNQKSAEWSEEDKRCLSTAICIIQNEFGDDCETVKWLKSLKNRGNFPKSNTNSPSWSEEDEKMLDEIISNITGYDTYTGTIMQLYKVHEKKIDWLKSLRPHPHWKPSEEQMEALCGAIEQMRDSFPESYIANDALDSLYDDLKKLMQ